jgi:XTP/dITP diphosphohydrolase
MFEIIIATANKGKQREIQEIIDLPVKWIIDPEIVKVLEGVETGSTFYDNASLKALAAAKYSGKIALADDSGLEVPSLDNRPGIMSARYSGENASDAENVDKLLNEMKGLEVEKRLARFVCVAVLASEEGVVASARGECVGKITFKPEGENGFGYDPVFQPLGYKKTMAELNAADKNKISHRGEALRKIKKEIKKMTPK